MDKRKEEERKKILSHQVAKNTKKNTNLLANTSGTVRRGINGRKNDYHNQVSYYTSVTIILKKRHTLPTHVTYAKFAKTGKH